MKKVIIGLLVLSVLLIGVAVYAQNPVQKGDGFINCNSCYKLNKIGHGHNGHMMRGTDSSYNQKFLNDTLELRKELHSKKFEYFEAIRNPKTELGKITELEKEIKELKDKIRSYAPAGMHKGFNRACWRM